MGWRFSFLPQLAWGRGTARRSRGVEGQARSRLSNHSAHHGVEIAQHVGRRYAYRGDPTLRHPPVAYNVALGTIAPVVRFAVDLDRKTRIGTEKIEDIVATWMLSAELQAVRSGAKRLPQQHFGKRHLAAKFPRISDAVRTPLGRNILEHRDNPSTMLRMVPLPETSSGRN